MTDKQTAADPKPHTPPPAHTPPPPPPGKPTDAPKGPPTPKNVIKEDAPHTMPALKTKAEPEAPILPGYEGDGSAYETVILTSSTLDQGTPFRIAKTPELPLSLAHGGARYLISNHAQKLYVWQVK